MKKSCVFIIGFVKFLLRVLFDSCEWSILDFWFFISKYIFLEILLPIAPSTATIATNTLNSLFFCHEFEIMQVILRTTSQTHWSKKAVIKKNFHYLSLIIYLFIIYFKFKRNFPTDWHEILDLGRYGWVKFFPNVNTKLILP